MFGTYFFPWRSAYELNPFIGYLLLINPMVYVIEGMRAATLGQEGYLPYWIMLRGRGAAASRLWTFLRSRS